MRTGEADGSAWPGHTWRNPSVTVPPLLLNSKLLTASASQLIYMYLASGYNYRYFYHAASFSTHLPVPFW